MRIEINKYIVADSEMCHGKPTFNGTRVMIWQILEMLRDGADVNEILEAFPSLSIAHIKAALQYAADVTRGKENVIVNIPLES